MDFEQLKQMLQRDLAEASRGRYWKPRVGQNRVRILPPWREGVPFYKLARSHWIGSRSVPCEGEGCVVCELLRMGVGAGKISTFERYLVNMVDLDTDPNHVYVWPMPYTVWSAIGEIIISGHYGDVTDPDT